MSEGPLLLSADNLCKQFEFRSISGLTEHWSKLFNTLIVFPKIFFAEKVNFEESQQTTTKR